MYYTIRSTGPKSKKELIQYYLMVLTQILKWTFSLFILSGLLVAAVTKNVGALALLTLTIILLGATLNFLNLRRWLPGIRKGSWFTKTLALSCYVFLAMAVLLIAGPAQP